MREAPNISPPKNQEQGHWYQLKGDGVVIPMHSEGKTYGLAQARKDNEDKCIVPSVTTILGTRYNYAIDKYGKTQVALAARRLASHSHNYSEEEWVDGVLWDAKKELREASKRGTEVHLSIEMFLKGDSVKPEHYNICRKVEEIINSECPLVHGVEKMVGCAEGFAGTVDVFGRTDHDKPNHPAVIDFKTRKTTKGRKPTVYPKDRQQIATYGYAAFGCEFFDRGFGGSVIISSTEPDRVEYIPHRRADFERWFLSFRHTMLAWQLEHNYTPNREAIDES